jgi:hypothetical protein
LRIGEEIGFVTSRMSRIRTDTNGLLQFGVTASIIMAPPDASIAPAKPNPAYRQLLYRDISLCA